MISRVMERAFGPVAVGIFLAVLSLSLPAEVPEGPPVFSDPLEFDNTYFPFEVGAFKVFVGHEEGAQIVIIDFYHAATRSFPYNGGNVECRILEEIEFEDGELAEISQNFFNQADSGAAYYWGEVVDDYEDGEIVSHGGSWLVGGPQAGDPPETATAASPALFMPADPEVGDVFKPEDLFPFVDETATVVREDVVLHVPAGDYEDSIVIEETSQLSDGFETKVYGPGVGVARILNSGNVSLYASTLVPEEEE